MNFNLFQEFMTNFEIEIFNRRVRHPIMTHFKVELYCENFLFD